MNDPTSNKLSPAGRQRRASILTDVLAASSRRQRRRRHLRTGLAISFGALLIAGVPYLISLRNGQELAHHDPVPTADDQRPAPPVQAMPAPSPARPTLIVEMLTDEMLLAQLDQADLPYLQTADGEVRLIATGYNPWVMDEPVADR